jgi:hypothetical protein
MDEEISRESVEIDSDTGAGGGIFKAKNASSVPNLPNDMSMCVTPQPSRQRDSIDETRRNAGHAQNYERKLLKSGHREITAAHGEA